MSHASSFPWAAIPEDVEKKIASYGDAIVSRWVPQQQVLDHPVRVLTLSRIDAILITEGIGGWMVHLTRRPQWHLGNHNGRCSHVRSVPVSTVCPANTGVQDPMADCG